MKKFLIVFCLAAASLAVSAEVVPMFITGGQSNTDGRLDGRSKGQELPHYIANGNSNALVSVASGPSAKGGTFRAFAPATRQKDQPARWAYDAVTYYYIGQAIGTFYVAKTAYGGTSIDPHCKNSPSRHAHAWLPQYGAGYHWSADPEFLAATQMTGTTFERDGVTYDGQSLLLAWIQNIDASIDALVAAGKEPDIKAILWHQGESDRHAARRYKANLLSLVTYVRQHLVKKTGKTKYAKIPFFCGTIPVQSRGASSVNKAFQELNDDPLNNIFAVDISDITLKSDNIHFSAEGAEIFGRRLYNRLVDEGIITGQKVDAQPVVREPAKEEDATSAAVEAPQRLVEKAPWGVVEVTVPNFPARDFSIADYEGNINAAMTACAAAGGGRVVVPEGTWLSKGPIHFKSNCLLWLDEKAELRFSDNPQDYLPAVHTTWEGSECMNYSPLIYAYNCENVGIAGKGTIHPIRAGWAKWDKRPPAHMQMTANLYHWMSTNAVVSARDVTKDAGNFRPHLIQFNRSKNILLRDFRIRESPFWTTHLYLCKSVLMEGVDSYAHGHNNDGVDVEMSQDVIIRNCRFDQGDDGIVLKSGRNQDAWRLNTPTRNVVVRDCTLVEGHGLLVLGSEMAGGVENIYMHDCRAIGKKVLRMMYLKTNERRGGFLRNVWMERCTANNIRHGVLEIATDVLYQWAQLPTYEVRLTEIDNINMSDCTIEQAECLYRVVGDKRRPIETVTLKNVRVSNAVKESIAKNVTALKVE